MALKSKRAGSREADPQNAVLAGRSIGNSENTLKVQSSVAVDRLRAAHLRARFGLSEALSRVVAAHAFGESDDGDYWIPPANAAAATIASSARATEARS